MEADAEARRILGERFGIRQVDPLVELEVLLHEARRPNFAEWEAVWSSLRRVPLSDASKLLRENRGTFRVRTVAGTWVQPWDALLPGSVVPGSGARDAEIALDMTLHGKDAGALDLLGVVEAPTAGGLAAPELQMATSWPNPNWQHRYREACVDDYQAQGYREAGARAQSGSISMKAQALAGPLSPFFRLSDEGKEAFVQRLLPLAAAEEPVTWYHDTQRRYPDLEADSPAQWLIRTYAEIPTSLGPRRPDAAVGRDLVAWQALLPVAANVTPCLACPPTGEGA